MVDHREQEEKTSVGSTYQPLSVWKTQEFNVLKIEAECTDTEGHPVLGKNYNLNLKTVSKAEITKQVWKDLYDLSKGGKAHAKPAGEKKNQKKKRGVSAPRQVTAARRVQQP